MTSQERKYQTELQATQAYLRAKLQEQPGEWRYWEHDALTSAQIRSKLNSVDRALRRLDNGEFGTCAKCHLPIEPERLALLPHTELCSRCEHQLIGAVVRRAQTARCAQWHDEWV